MIPVVTSDKEGNMSYQVFNDNLTVAEQINRVVLGVTAYAQTKLVNDKNAFDKKVDNAEYTTEQLDKVKKAALELDSAVKEAVAAFAKVVADPDSADE